MSGCSRGASDEFFKRRKIQTNTELGVGGLYDEEQRASTHVTRPLTDVWRGCLPMNGLGTSLFGHLKLPQATYRDRTAGEIVRPNISMAPETETFENNLTMAFKTILLSIKTLTGSLFRCHRGPLENPLQPDIFFNLMSNTKPESIKESCWIQ
jgi:hypothetical protein